MQLICSATLVSDVRKVLQMCVWIYIHIHIYFFFFTYILLKILFQYVIYFMYIVVCIFYFQTPNLFRFPPFPILFSM